VRPFSDAEGHRAAKAAKEAHMAHTFAGKHLSAGAAGALNSVGGAFRESAVKWTVDAAYTYTTNGVTGVITPATLGLSNIFAIAPVVFSTGHWGYWDDSVSKLKVFSAAGTELVNASAALQGATALIQAIGL
jgi:hypothetical protein